MVGGEGGRQGWGVGLVDGLDAEELASCLDKSDGRRKVKGRDEKADGAVAAVRGRVVTIVVVTRAVAAGG